MTVEEFNRLREECNAREINRRHVRNQEHDLQCRCVRWFRYSYPDILIFAIPNGGARSKSQGAKLKAEGVLAGVPDLYIPYPCGRYHGMWVEMKNGKAGRLEQVQKNVIAKLEDQGYLVKVIRSFEEFETEINNYINGTKQK